MRPYGSGAERELMEGQSNSGYPSSMSPLGSSKHWASTLQFFNRPVD